MMRSMFSGVSGLRAHQTRMDVIGNNVANVNTVGFKSGRVTFQEIFSQTLKGAGAPDQATGRGGINPMQVGLGLGVGAVDTIMTRGSVQRTDNPTDLAIEGEGFFVVQGGKGDTYRFTRAGNFGIDKLGNLVTSGGLNVLGWQEYKQNTDGSYTFNTENPIEPINLYSDDYNKNKKIIAAKATANAVFAGNLDSAKATIASPTMATDVQMSVPMTIYDKLGNEYKLNVRFVKTAATATTSTWSWDVDMPADMTISSPSFPQTVTFNADGSISSTAPAVTKFTLNMVPAATKGTDAFNVDFDFGKLTTYNGDSSVKPTNIDGYSTGNLVTFNVGSDGIITGIYSNGQQKPLGMVGIATFENAAGMQKVGDNLFIPTTNSGDFKKAVKPGSDGAGMLNPGTLEMSNVDLSKEFTEMIVTQRGFQANSRIITTTDEMLQELVNLKR